jgi:hypothetical protein
VKEHANLNAPATIVEEESIEPPADTTVDESSPQKKTQDLTDFLCKD